MADIERRHGASVAPMRAVATGGDGARGVTSGATRGDEHEPDSFEVDRDDVERGTTTLKTGGSHLALKRYTVKRRPRSTPTQPVVSLMRVSAASHAHLHPSAMCCADMSDALSDRSNTFSPF